ncbi:MAG: hypothetical protein GEV11_29440 [Streptosporangiales bacterium]|nr:hypothetical protein [Streptosporangiales bacterium]
MSIRSPGVRSRTVRAAGISSEEMVEGNEPTVIVPSSPLAAAWTSPTGLGTLYAPGKGEEHRLTTAHGLRVICVFSPALKGDENHRLVPGRPSGF